MNSDLDLYRDLYLIRRFEETVVENFPRGIFPGTTHVYIGQEANAVGILSQRAPGDIVFSNHRCHGHYLAFGGNTRQLFAELMGKETGMCAGRGGSQHVHWENFYSNGVQGGIAPVATGMALAEKYKGTRAVSIVFLGDGTLGEGVVYESLNLAALWQAPVLYVLENNHIAQTTPIELALAGSVTVRFDAFGIPVIERDTSDVREIASLAAGLFKAARATQSPRALVLHTCRFAPHSKGDDTRPGSEIERMRQERDPLAIQSTRLPPEDRKRVELFIEAAISTAFTQALADPYPDPGSL
jgi:acetoin:2,6-dichlorophenolindophenol oxidoreductase subunit alpha